MVNCLHFSPLGAMYHVKSLMKAADRVFLILVRDEIDCTGCGFLCGDKLVVTEQRPRKVLEAPRLPPGVLNSFENGQSFLSLSYPFLVKIEEQINITRVL